MVNTIQLSYCISQLKTGGFMERDGNFIQGFFFGGLLSILLWIAVFGWINIMTSLNF